MTCCLDIKQQNRQAKGVIFWVKSVAKYVAFSSSGKDFFVHVVDTDCVPNQGMESTS
jgi:hypothetical protein